jgi:hypothetical protein
VGFYLIRNELIFSLTAGEKLLTRGTLRHPVIHFVSVLNVIIFHSIK